MVVSISIFTIIIAILLIYFNWKNNKNTIFLGGFLIILSLYSLVHCLLSVEKSVFWSAVLFNHISPLTLIPGPLLFWYTRNTLRENQKLNKIDYLHFIPAILQFFAIIPYCLKPFSYKLEIVTKIINNVNNINLVSYNMVFNTFQNFTIRFGLFLIYIIISIAYLANNTFSESKISPRNKTPKNLINWLWIVNISPLIIVVVFLDLTYNCTLNQPSVGLAKTHFLLLVSEISFFILAFSLLLFPNILYGMPITVPTKKNKLKNISDKNKEPEIIRELDKEDPLNEIITKISTYIEDKKPYLNPNFSIDTISIDLKITVSQASECLTIIYGTKFSEIKKQLRVAYAKQLLENNTTEYITIDAIGQKCGFTTRSNFYSAFKSITNSTPSQYLSNLKEKK